MRLTEALTKALRNTLEAGTGGLEEHLRGCTCLLHDVADEKRRERKLAVPSTIRIVHEVTRPLWQQF